MGSSNGGWKSDRFGSARCRSCGSQGLKPVIDLGLMPLSNALRTADRLDEPERRYPLEVGFCPHCALVQILETIPCEELFPEDYVYFSSYSEDLLAHAKRNAEELMITRCLGPENLVVELASNDGYLLRNFVDRGVPVLGIDPARRQAEMAERLGVPTRCAFFNSAMAERLVEEEGLRADVILACNVLAHVADTNDFVAGIRRLLKPNGEAVVEVPYVRELIERREFDTIYHEHLCYFSLASLEALFNRHGLHVSKVRRLPIHGGSLRIHARLVDEPGLSVHKLREEEARLGLTGVHFYERFAREVEALRSGLRRLVEGVLSEGARLAGYGAAAKGAVLLNHVGFGPEEIRYVVDRNVRKQGHYMPGVRIPIERPERLLEDKPDHVLLLAWNFHEEIERQQAAYRSTGGRFIVPIPEPRIV